MHASNACQQAHFDVESDNGTFILLLYIYIYSAFTDKPDGNCHRDIIFCTNKKMVFMERYLTRIGKIL
jgi:hypothetical protein